MMTAGNSAKVHDARGPEAFAQLIELEQQAEQIFHNQPIQVPGLLQRPGYAAGLLRGITGLPEGDTGLAERVSQRVSRAEAFEQRLRGPNPPQLWAVVDESALRRKVGGAEVMRDQIAHLIALSQLESVHLAITPFSTGGHQGQVGTFEVHQVAGGQAALFFEGAAGDELVVSDQERARSLRELVAGLVTSSVTGSEARQLLEQISEEL
jgi:Domain of unknown function (DUF5753)